MTLIARFLRLFDWRLVLTMTLMLMVVFLVWSGFASHQRAERAGERVDQLLSTVHDERAAADERARLDAVERSRLLRSQRAQSRELRTQTKDLQELARRYAQLERRQAALLRWLREQGIQPPATVLRIERRVVSGPSASGPRPRSSRPSSSSPRAPRSSRPVAPKAGKSGKTPRGKAKGLRRGGRR